MLVRRASVAGAAIVACLTATGVAAGTPTWGAPVQVSPNGDGGESVVAADARGDTGRRGDEQHVATVRVVSGEDEHFISVGT